MLNIDDREIITGVATNLIEDSIRGAWDKVKCFFYDLNAKELIEYGDAYEKYLENTKTKNSKIKTLIYRHEPKDLHSFYECVGVCYNGKIIDTISINNLITNESKIIITGAGGIGKTTLLKHLYLSGINETALIPVMIELRSFNIVDSKEISLFDFIYKNLVDNGFLLEKKYFEYSLENGGYIILLDGYDEVNRDKKVKITDEIKGICCKYNKNKFIMTSRPTDEFIGWNDFAEMVSKDLSKKQALSLIRKIEFDEKIKNIFYSELRESLYKKYQSFASNPLLLTIMLLTFDSHASIPDKLNDFYEQAFATLFNMHDATKDAYVRDIRTGLGCEDFKLVFAYICFKSYFSDTYEFTEFKLKSYIQKAKDKFKNINFSVDDFENDLIHSVCMIVKEGLNYRFTHRSFQEYFAAWYTCKLTDDIQSKLLNNWIKESNFREKDTYFNMLFDLQTEKVNKIIFSPALKIIKGIYETKGFSIELLSDLFEGITTMPIKQRKDDTENIKVSLRIKDTYLCYALSLTINLNGYKRRTTSSGSEQELAKKIREIKTTKDERYISFDEIGEFIENEQLLNGLKWVEDQILFGISIFNRYSDNSISKKRKVATILEEL